MCRGGWWGDENVVSGLCNGGAGDAQGWWWGARTHLAVVHAHKRLGVCDMRHKLGVELILRPKRRIGKVEVDRPHQLLVERLGKLTRAHVLVQALNGRQACPGGAPPVELLRFSVPISELLLEAAEVLHAEGILLLARLRKLLILEGVKILVRANKEEGALRGAAGVRAVAERAVDDLTLGDGSGGDVAAEEGEALEGKLGDVHPARRPSVTGAEEACKVLARLDLRHANRHHLAALRLLDGHPPP